MPTTTVSGAVLAAVLEIECTEGRDPNKLIDSFVKNLRGVENVDISKLAGSNSGRRFRAFHSLVTCLGSNNPSRLKASLAAVDSLTDFCEEPRRGKLGAVVALGTAARAGRAWTLVRASANELPDLPDQLPDLLDSLSAGELVAVAGIDSTPVRLILEELFELLGLYDQKGEDGNYGFGLPEEESREERILVRCAVECLSSILRNSDTMSFGAVSSIDETEKKTKIDVPEPKAPRGPTLPTTTDLAAARTAKGPTMPTVSQLAASRMKRPLEEEEYSDGDGPKPQRDGEVWSEESDDESPEDKLMKRQLKEAEWAMVKAGKTAAEAAQATARATTQMHTGGREEWMLVAPKDGGVLASLKKAGPTNRGFQQMVPHTKQWADQDDPELNRQQQSDAGLEKMLADSRSARGPSLIEQHQQSMASAGKKPKAGASTAFKFEHGEVIGGTRVTAHDLGGMIADAKALDSRFSRSVTKNFM